MEHTKKAATREEMMIKKAVDELRKLFALIFVLLAALELGAGIEGLQNWGCAVLLAFAAGFAAAVLIAGGEVDE